MQWLQQRMQAAALQLHSAMLRGLLLHQAPPFFFCLIFFELLPRGTLTLPNIEYTLVANLFEHVARRHTHALGRRCNRFPPKKQKIDGDFAAQNKHHRFSAIFGLQNQ